jgi:hypothetical protein
MIACQKSRVLFQDGVGGYLYRVERNRHGARRLNGRKLEPT